MARVSLQTCEENQKLLGNKGGSKMWMLETHLLEVNREPTRVLMAANMMP